MQKHKLSNKGIRFIAAKEGMALTKYKDSVGVWTIGIGMTRSEIPNLAKWPRNRKLTVKQAVDMFIKALAKYERAVNRFLTRPVRQYEFDALVSWCYNVGPGWLEKSTVMRRINSGKKGKTLYNALMMYKKPPEIIGRRRAEANLLAYGRYPSRMVTNIFPVSKSGRPVYARGKSVDLAKYLTGEAPIVHKVEPKPTKRPLPQRKVEKVKDKPGEVSWISTIIEFILNLFRKKS